ncbi:MAG TPA: FAD-binding oxidoreductase, partial [Aquihabitans sp.]|nr:FAD-binding oxidoreductase [Aquihabitans sp.]
MTIPPIRSSLFVHEDARRYPALAGDREADVVVVGGGIAGTTTAALLGRAGLEVVLLEAREIGTGTTGRSTAKATALQSIRYQVIANEHGATGASRFATAQLDALAWMDEQVRALGVDCEWERRPAITYAMTPDGRPKIEEEARAAAAAGLHVTLEESFDELPFPTSGGVVLADQAQLDPGPYLAALAAELADRPNGTVHEQSRVTAVKGRRKHQVVTEHGTVTADHVVVATLLPIVDRGLFFARAEPRSSYVVAVAVDGPIPQGMYINPDGATRSLRTSRDRDGREVLLIGGGGHDTGRGSPTSEHYEELIGWASEHFPGTETVARWSAHDYVPADHLPWVGSAFPLTPRVLVATGFEKWGITMGTAAALALADRVLGESDGPSAPWASLFDPGRTRPRGLVSAARINAEVAGRMASDWLRPDAPAAADGSGRRHRDGLLPVGDPVAG